MAYTNSKMVAYTKLSPNHSGQRTHSIDRITPHCVVSQCTAEGLGDWFAKASTQASSNYGIDKNGRVGLYIEEKNRSWCSSSNANDQRAVTIECASDTKEPYWMNDKVYASLIKLCVDICKRNGKKKLLWFANKDKTLNYAPKSNEMVLTVHRWFANKSCPGNWLYSRLGDLAAKVTSEISKTSSGGVTASTSQIYRVRKTWSDSKSQLGAYKLLANAKKKADENAGYKVFDASGNIVYPNAAKPVQTPAADTSYKVQIDITNLNIRKGPGTNYGKTGQFTGKGIFTIVQESKGEGATLWGKLKSGAGWISLDFAKKV